MLNDMKEKKNHSRRKFDRKLKSIVLIEELNVNYCYCLIEKLFGLLRFILPSKIFRMFAAALRYNFLLKLITLQRDYI